MAPSVKPNIREMLLAEINEQEPKNSYGANLQQGSILQGVSLKLGQNRSLDQEQAVLTQWGELFRTGLLAWGFNLSNPNSPFFHLTERGRQAFQNLNRDPSNPNGYLRHLSSVASLKPVALSYLKEGLECYVAGLFKAAAVMVGASAESVIIDLRDETVLRLQSLGKSVPKEMGDWRVKAVSDALRSFFDTHIPKSQRELREPFEAYWAAFAQQIRAARNDAGHPSSVDPVTPDTVHASLLIFPELSKLANGLSDWVADNLG